jgi:hypothetical protein
MKRILLLSVAAIFTVLMGGCAHPINMKPDMGSVTALGASKIDKAVGFHISDANLAVEVTTPGGGGDKVRYFPYRDIEAGFYKALTEVFTKVSKISNPKDLDAISKAGITLLITPEISTTSASPSLLTWPPTEFSVTLDCRIIDATGKLVTVVSVRGVGKAEFSDFKSNFSLSAVRASEDVLKQLMKKLAETKALAQ